MGIVNMKVFFYLFLLSSLQTLALESVKPDKLIIFKKTPEIDLKLHTFYPKNYDKNKQYPVIIFFWGGGFRDWRPEQFYRQARYFSEYGMMAYAGEYRVKSRHDVTMFDCVKDAKSAIRFLKKNADVLNIDSSRIIASGGSSGGMIAACTEFIDHVNDDQDDLNFTSRPNALILYNPQLNIRRYEDINPMKFVDANSAPTLIFHGTSDEIVSYTQAIDFKERMNAHNNRCDVKLYHDMPHSFFNITKYNETLSDTHDFIRSLGWIE